MTWWYWSVTLLNRTSANCLDQTFEEIHSFCILQYSIFFHLKLDPLFFLSFFLSKYLTRYPSCFHWNIGHLNTKEKRNSLDLQRLTLFDDVIKADAEFKCEAVSNRWESLGTIFWPLKGNDCAHFIPQSTSYLVIPCEAIFLIFFFLMCIRSSIAKLLILSPLCSFLCFKRALKSIFQCNSFWATYSRSCTLFCSFSCHASLKVYFAWTNVHERCRIIGVLKQIVQ